MTAITEALIELHRRHYHRAPVTGKTMLLGDDLIACVLGGVYTDVEKTLIEMQKSPMVQETRSTFQNATQQKFFNVIWPSSQITTSVPTSRSSCSC